MAQGHHNERYTVEQMGEALANAGGVLNWAAEILGCNAGTVRRYLDTYPELEKVRDLAREITLDIAEQQLITKIKQGNLTAAIFYLKCIGKHRGYIERGELEIRNRQPVVLLLPHEDDAPLELTGGNGRTHIAALPASDDGQRTVFDALPHVAASSVDERLPDGWRGGAAEPEGDDRRTADEIDGDGGPY